MKKAIVPVLCAVVAGLLSGCAAKTLLIVTQYPDGSPRSAATEAAIRKVIRFENLPFDLYVYNMDASQRISDIWRQQAGDNAVVRVTDVYQPHITFVVGDEAARFFAQRLVEQPRKMIFLDIKADPSDYKLAQSRYVTGVVEETPVTELFELVRELVPAARGVAVLSDTSLEGNAVVSKIRQAGPLAVPLVDIRQVKTLAEWMAAVQDLQQKADALCIVSYHTLLKESESSDTVPADEVLRLTSQINRLPDFSFALEAVGPEGVLAAVAIPIEAQARLAAKMAVRNIYYDEKIGNMRVAFCGERATKISHERAAKLGVTLPAPQTVGPEKP
jgi:ABC-type uncharacterized transport system substrate-binding protein